MAYTEIFAATTAVKTDAAAFAMSGFTKIKADGLSEGEWLILQEEDAAGTTYSNVRVDGQPVLITARQPSIIFYGLGSYKLMKPQVTANAVGAGYESA